MSSIWCLKHAQAFKPDRLRPKMIEEANALTHQHIRNIHMEFIEQTRLQSLLDRAGTMQTDIFLACQFSSLSNRALDAIGDKVELRLTLFLWCAGLRLQDQH